MLSVKNFALTCGFIWGGGLCAISLIQLISPTYGVGFLSVMESVYPGYQGMEGLIGGVVILLYGLLAGVVAGGAFAWLYNKLNS